MSNTVQEQIETCLNTLTAELSRLDKLHAEHEKSFTIDDYSILDHLLGQLGDIHYCIYSRFEAALVGARPGCDCGCGGDSLSFDFD